MSYIVAFRYTEAAGAYAGVVTWTSFASKEAFDKWWQDFPRKSEEEVLEQGITDERAVELTRSTPALSRVNVARFESTNPATGEVDDDLLRMNLHKQAMGL